MPPSHPTSSRRLQVLLLEDSPADQQLIAAILSQEGLVVQPTFARNGQEFKRALEQTAFDIILSDFNLPDYNGSEALALARRLRPEVPFVLVTATLGEERAVEILHAGATDYVLKSHLERLP